MPRREPSPIQGASNKEIEDVLEKFQPVEDPDELPREITRVKKVPGLEKLRGEDVTELSESDLEEIPQEIELAESDLEEIAPTKGTTRRAEYRVVESKEDSNDLKYGLAKEASPEHPDRNEDEAFYNEKAGVQFVADGMGGVPAGDIASQKAAEQLMPEGLRKADADTRRVLESGRDTVLDQASVEKAVDAIIKQMNAEITKFNEESPVVLEKAQAYFKKELNIEYDPENPDHKSLMGKLLKSIGCTVSMSKIWRGAEGKDHLTIGNIGDSRTYILRKGKLEQISRDDSHVQVLIEEGLIPNDEDVMREVDRNTIIALADKRHELRSLVPKLTQISSQRVTLDRIRNNVTQAVGGGAMMKEQTGLEFTPFVKTVDLEDGDLVLTASDGVIDNLTDTEIQNILSKSKDSPLEAAQKLQEAATERSIKGKAANPRAKKDDVTALVTLYKKT